MILLITITMLSKINNKRVIKLVLVIYLKNKKRNLISLKTWLIILIYYNFV